MQTIGTKGVYITDANTRGAEMSRYYSAADDYELGSRPTFDDRLNDIREKIHMQLAPKKERRGRYWESQKYKFNKRDRRLR